MLIDVCLGEFVEKNSFMWKFFEKNGENMISGDEKNAIYKVLHIHQ